MAIQREVKRLTKREHYAADYSTVVRQRDNDTTTTLQIRRVRQPGSAEDELQVEINIDKHHANRTVSAHSSFVVPAQLADVIGDACLRYNENYPRKEW